MSRYRLYPDAAQEQKLLAHCRHARYVWNLALEQLNYWRRGQRTPGFAEQCRQLVEARRENEWLAEGPSVIQQQALRDFDIATKNWWAGKRRRPKWRKLGQNEGFRIVGDRRTWQVKKINRRWSSVQIPKVGWVKFRRTRDYVEAKSFRVTLDSSGRWHVAFSNEPVPLSGPTDGSVVGIDRGIKVTLALSDGAVYQAPEPLPMRQAQRAFARCKRGSNRRKLARARVVRLHARTVSRRKDWAEKASTDIARHYDVIRIEDLKVANMVRSARGTVENPGSGVRAKTGLNRSIAAAGWTIFATRLGHKAAGRVERVSPAFTSQTCSTCGIKDRKARESQAVFRCRSCGYVANADLNAAKNIAAGRAVRGADQLSASKRRPQ